MNCEFVDCVNDMEMGIFFLFTCCTQQNIKIKINFMKKGIGKMEF